MPFLKIIARRFAQLLGCTVVIHEIVHQLERHPEMITKSHQRLFLFFIGF